LRWLALVFVALIIGLQYPMWLGKGGWFQVRELGRDVARQHDANAQLKARNDALDAEVRDLKTGFDAIEERARAELGMIRQDEVFFQVQPDSGRGGAAAAAPGSAEAASAPSKSIGTSLPAAPLR
jgi:cell division protein FtsB